jgi:hypothetical protein
MVWNKGQMEKGIGSILGVILLLPVVVFLRGHPICASYARNFLGLRALGRISWGGEGSTASQLSWVDAEYAEQYISRVEWSYGRALALEDAEEAGRISVLLQDLYRSYPMTFEISQSKQLEASWRLYQLTGDWPRDLGFCSTKQSGSHNYDWILSQSFRHQAITLRNEQRYEKAVEKYLLSLDYNPRNVETVFHLSELHRLQGKGSLSNQLERDFLSHGPGVRVNARVGKDWRLVGYDISEYDLARWPQVPALLEWEYLGEGPPRDDSLKMLRSHPRERVYASGRHFFQLLELTNLVPNAGMEMDLFGTLGMGWPLQTGYQPLGTAFVRKSRDDSSDNVLVLRNSSEGEISVVKSLHFRVHPGEYYLQAAHLKTTGGTNTSLSRVCSFSVPKGVTWSHLAYSVSPTTWKPYAGVWQASSSTLRCVWQASIHGTPGDAVIDDLLFTEIHPPLQEVE